MASYCVDWFGRYRGSARGVVLPRTTDSGVVVVLLDRADEVIAIAREIAAAEQTLSARLATGGSFS